MPVNSTKDRFIPILGEFTPQIGLFRQTLKGAMNLRPECVERC